MNKPVFTKGFEENLKAFEMAVRTDCSNENYPNLQEKSKARVKYHQEYLIGYYRNTLLAYDLEIAKKNDEIKRLNNYIQRTNR